MESSHWQPFLEFSSYELWAGGPDPHLQLAVEAAKEILPDPHEAAWRIGCYMSPYVISTGAAIWENWDIWKVRNDPEGFTRWIDRTWKNWQIRRERRAARTVDKMSRSMLSYAEWVINELPQIATEGYETLWNSTDKNLLFYGRYANIKILEALYRADLITNSMPDIRPKGAWSPRKTLAWLFPDHEQALLGKDTHYNLFVVNDKTEMLRQAVSGYVGQPVSTFQVEVLLCNYRQVLDTRNGRYPGWSQDADLAYHKKIEESFGRLQFDFYGLREKFFPSEVLGEKQGWFGPRKMLCGYKNYFWTDKLYDYHMSLKDLHNPVRRK